MKDKSVLGVATNSIIRNFEKLEVKFIVSFFSASKDSYMNRERNDNLKVHRNKLWYSD